VIVSALAGLSCLTGVVVFAAQVLPIINVEQRVYDTPCTHIVALNKYLICRAAQDEGTSRAATIEQPQSDW
jgi:hypothetical protein